MQQWEALSTIRRLSEASATVDRRIGVTFGESADPLGEAKHTFASLPYAQYFRQNSPAAFELMESKILVQAAKLSAVLALCHEADRQADADQLTPYQPVYTVDAAPWLPMAYTLIGHCHISNAYHEIKMTQMQEQMDKVIAVIRRAGNDITKKTRRQVCRCLNLKSREAQELLDLLEEDGTLKRVPGKICYYKLSRNRQ